jgi:Ca2+-binding RTX toxin-like protein
MRTGRTSRSGTLQAIRSTLPPCVPPPGALRYVRHDDRTIAIDLTGRTQMKRILLSTLAAMLVLGLSAIAVQAHVGAPVRQADQATCAANGAGNDQGDDNPAGDREGTSGDDHENGTSSDDVIDGNAGDDDIAGDAGDDDICGDAGDDHMAGGAGDDKLSGGSGDDVESGGAGDDDIQGDKGDDRITGGPGADVIVAGAGNDRIFARDGRRDRISCGSGDDTVSADRLDRVTASCEHVRRS